jgi:hypothetical protein
MGDAVTVDQSKAGNVDDGAKRRQRRPKSGNSELFNDLLSEANRLSVAERTRLVKSLAGQLGLLTVGGQSLIGQPASAGEPKKAKQGRVSEDTPPVRQNPLKGTKFWVDKEAAKAAMLKAREDGGGAQLPQNHPAVTAYALALKAYKDEQAKLKPVDTQSVQQVVQSAKQTGSKKRAASKSPERSGGNVLTRASSAAKRLINPKSSTSKDEMDVS